MDNLVKAVVPVPEIKPQISTELKGVKCCNCCFRRASPDDDIDIEPVKKATSKQQVVINNVIMFLRARTKSFIRSVSD